MMYTVASETIKGFSAFTSSGPFFAEFIFGKGTNSSKVLSRSVSARAFSLPKTVCIEQCGDSTRFVEPTKRGSETSLNPHRLLQNENDSCNFGINKVPGAQNAIMKEDVKNWCGDWSKGEGLHYLPLPSGSKILHLNGSPFAPRYIPNYMTSCNGVEEPKLNCGDSKELFMSCEKPLSIGILREGEKRTNEKKDQGLELDNESQISQSTESNSHCSLQQNICLDKSEVDIDQPNYNELYAGYERAYEELIIWEGRDKLTSCVDDIEMLKQEQTRLEKEKNDLSIQSMAEKELETFLRLESRCLIEEISENGILTDAELSMFLEFKHSYEDKEEDDEIKRCEDVTPTGGDKKIERNNENNITITTNDGSKLLNNEENHPVDLKKSYKRSKTRNIAIYFVKAFLWPFRTCSINARKRNKC